MRKSLSVSGVRLSREDELQGESNSIFHQKQLLEKPNDPLYDKKGPLGYNPNEPFANLNIYSDMRIGLPNPQQIGISIVTCPPLEIAEFATARVPLCCSAMDLAMNSPIP